MNTYSAIGRVGKDAALRNAGSKKVLSFSVAVDSGWGDRKTTVWLDCSLWGDRGEKLAEHINKGDRIGVTGELGTREYEGKTYVTLDVRDVTLLGGKSDTPKAKRAESAADDVSDDDIPF